MSELSNSIPDLNPTLGAANQPVQDTSTPGTQITWFSSKQGIAGLSVAFMVVMVFSFSMLWGPALEVHTPHASEPRVAYSPPKPLFTNQTDHAHKNTHCDFVEAMLKNQFDTLGILLLEEINNFRVRLDLADIEFSSEFDSQNLGELWKTLASELNLLVRQSRLINIQGKWEMQLLFEEYYAFNQANLAARADSPTLMMSNLIRIMNSLLEMSDLMSRVISEATKVNSQVQRILYVRGKKLSNSINQSGILQHGLRLIFGDTWIQQRKMELSLVQEGIEISKSVSHILAKLELTFKLCHVSGKLLLGSIGRIMQEPQPTKTIRSLVLLFSIFKCDQGANVISNTQRLKFR